MVAYETCVHCKEKIDIYNEEFVQIGYNKFAHKRCVELEKQSKIEQQEKDYKNLTDYIKKLFNIKNLTANIIKQIRDFRIEYNLTYNEMLLTLVYWYEVRKAPLERAEKRIGIIPYVCEDAKKYYEAIERVNNLNKNIKHQTVWYEMTIEAPRPEEKKPKLFNFEEDNNG